MSVSEEKSSPPGGPAVEHQKIGLPPPENSQQISIGRPAPGMKYEGFGEPSPSLKDPEMDRMVRERADQIATALFYESPPRQNFHQNSGRGLESATRCFCGNPDCTYVPYDNETKRAARCEGFGEPSPVPMPRSAEAKAELAATLNELAWSASPVMASSIPDSRSNCSSGAHEWDHKTHRCIHCQMPVMSFLNASFARHPSAAAALGCNDPLLGQQGALGISPAQIAAQRSEVNTVPQEQDKPYALGFIGGMGNRHWVYPASRYTPQVQKISQQQNPEASVETEVEKLRREVRNLREDVAAYQGRFLAAYERCNDLEQQNLAQAKLLSSMSGEQFPDTDGLFKARVEAAACPCGQTTFEDCAARPNRHCGGFDELAWEDARAFGDKPIVISAADDTPVNIEKAAQDTLDAMTARKLSRGMTEKLRDTAVESLRKTDRDASVGRAIGARFGGGLRQPW